VAPKSQGERRCKIKGGGQEMSLMVGYNGKKFNNNNLGKSMCPPNLTLKS